MTHTSGTREIPGGVTAPAGFVAAGLHSGIKPRSEPDLALLVSAREGPIAGVFTTNRVVAAPVLLDQRHVRRGRGRAIVVNSGNANACTGARGLADAKETATLVSRYLGIPLHTVFVGSTGVIGQRLPMRAIRRGLPRLVERLRRGGAAEAARAIMTTDTRIKQIAAQSRIGGRTVTIGGMAKGAGMIHPNMATLLAYVTTDAVIAERVLRRALCTAVAQSFNCISVDGDTSTNDTVLCLANGMAGNRAIKEHTAAFAAFQRLLTRACESLALQVCRDGEGITKVVRLVIKGARTTAEAKAIAQTVGTSCLVKTAVFGEDANWGRVLAAVGRSGVAIDPRRIRLTFDDQPIVRRGVGLGLAAERRVSRIVRRDEYRITVDLRMGRAAAWLWTTDLSYDYVKINASYRT